VSDSVQEIMVGRETEKRIAAALESQALETLKDAAIDRAFGAAGEIKGLVIATESDAKAMADHLGVLKDGQRIAKSLMDGLLAPLMRARNAVQGAFRPVFEVLEEAEKHGKNAIRAWNEHQERQQRLERERLEREAREAEARHRAEAAAALAAGRPAPLEPPPMEPPPPPRPATVVAGKHTLTYEYSVLHVEVSDVHEVAAFDPSLLALDESRAKAIYRDIEKLGALPTETHPLGGVVLHGMRFWIEKRVATK
jgi:hypothetical protein